MFSQCPRSSITEWNDPNYSFCFQQDGSHLLAPKPCIKLELGLRLWCCWILSKLALAMDSTFSAIKVVASSECHDEDME